MYAQHWPDGHSHYLNKLIATIYINIKKKSAWPRRLYPFTQKKKHFDKSTRNIKTIYSLQFCSKEKWRDRQSVRRVCAPIFVIFSTFLLLCAHNVTGGRTNFSRADIEGNLKKPLICLHLHQVCFKSFTMLNIWYDYCSGQRDETINLSSSV